MQFIKLQIGCLLVILYIEVTYIKATLNGKITCSRHFDLLMAVSPWAVFFDGFTAWTVNHMDLVPECVNRLAHLAFFIFMDLTIIITSEYMYEQLIGFDKNKKNKRFLIRIPGVISLLLILAGIGKLTYLHGSTTYYSMGFSVYVCYGTIIFYYGMILFLVITRFRFLPKEKVMGTLSFILIAGIILAAQIRFPEVLLTSIFPTMLLLGIYIDFENPFIRKLTLQNEEMLDGLAGEQIPLHARIMAIADVFDAVSQKRCYRNAMSLEESFAIIENGSGSDFDPRLVKIFQDAKEDVKELMENIEKKSEK